MTEMKKTIAAVAALALLSAAPAIAQECTPTASFDTVVEGTITVALTNTPPYSLEENGQISGIDGDLVKRFAEENCLEVAYSIFTYPGAVTSVQSGQADIALGGFYRTAARERVVRLSTPVYLDQLAVASIEGYDTVDQLIGKKVGTVEGYQWVADMENLFEGSGTYPSSLNLAQDLQSGRIEAALEGFGAAALLNADTDIKIRLLQADPRVEATMNPSQTSFLVSRNNQAFGDALDAAIEAYRADGGVAAALEAYGLDPSGAEVGEGRVIE